MVLYGFLITFASNVSYAKEEPTEEVLYNLCSDFFSGNKISEEAKAASKNPQSGEFIDLAIKYSKSQFGCPSFAKGFFIGQIGSKVYCLPDNMRLDLFIKIYVDYMEKHSELMQKPLGVGYAMAMRNSFKCIDKN